MMNKSFKTPFSLKNKRIFVAGHNGLVGCALVRRLAAEDCEILTVSRAALDLRDQAGVERWMAAHRPDVVILAAAKVGGIGANAALQADFLYDNMMISGNILRAAHRYNVEKLLFLGSSCIYPKNAVQPITEDALLTGALEPTNEAYAIAKIAGLKLAAAYRTQYGRDFISVMPCNLYGPHDRFDAQNSHVIPALMMKAHAAKMAGAEELTVWGSGAPLREFLYVDDLAGGLVFVLKHYSGAPPLNMGSGVEISIRALAEMIVEIVGFSGRIVFDPSKPDGTMRKLMDSSRISQMGWAPKTGLKDGLLKTYEWFKNQ